MTLFVAQLFYWFIQPCIALKHFRAKSYVAGFDPANLDSCWMCVWWIIPLHPLGPGENWVSHFVAMLI